MSAEALCLFVGWGRNLSVSLTFNDVVFTRQTSRWRILILEHIFHTIFVASFRQKPHNFPIPPTLPFFVGGKILEKLETENFHNSTRHSQLLLCSAGAPPPQTHVRDYSSFITSWYTRLRCEEVNSISLWWRKIKTRESKRCDNSCGKSSTNTNRNSVDGARRYMSQPRRFRARTIFSLWNTKLDFEI